MDFYATCAFYWGLTRWDAKNHILEWFYKDKPSLTYGGVYVQINPKTLNFIPSEARAEVLAWQGIIVGES